MLLPECDQTITVVFVSSAPDRAREHVRLHYVEEEHVVGELLDCLGKALCSLHAIGGWLAAAAEVDVGGDMPYQDALVEVGVVDAPADLIVQAAPRLPYLLKCPPAPCVPHVT